MKASQSIPTGIKWRWRLTLVLLRGGENVVSYLWKFNLNRLSVLKAKTPLQDAASQAFAEVLIAAQTIVKLESRYPGEQALMGFVQQIDEEVLLTGCVTICGNRGLAQVLGLESVAHGLKGYVDLFDVVWGEMLALDSGLVANQFPLPSASILLATMGNYLKLTKRCLWASSSLSVGANSRNQSTVWTR